jgi:ADP-ribosyl-[dinitrogen reductase] hydrolase
MINRSKVRGMFLGIASGDALGMPVETFTEERISLEFGKIFNYLKPDKHKWFDGQEAGTTTDDWQLTDAVANALIDFELNMDAQVRWHIKALKQTDSGWGNTTRNSVKNLMNGVNWSKSGLNDGSNGVGNGVAMKIAPVAAMFALSSKNNNLSSCVDFLVKLNNMTHPTKVSLMATTAICSALIYCLNNDRLYLEVDDLKKLLFSNFKLVSLAPANALYKYPDETDNIETRIVDLFVNLKSYFSFDFIKNYGGGSCYCYNSIPFSLGFFLKNPNSIETLYNVVSAGGDTDSNGAMVGAMLGALNGEEIFPKHLVDGLKVKDQVFELADRFCDKFLIC